MIDRDEFFTRATDSSFLSWLDEFISSSCCKVMTFSFDASIFDERMLSGR